MAHKKWVIAITNEEIMPGQVIYFAPAREDGGVKALLHMTEAMKFYSESQANAFIKRHLTLTKGAEAKAVLYVRGGNGDVLLEER